MTNQVYQKELSSPVKQPEPSDLHHTLNRFIDGAISGLVAGSILQPFQVIKTSMQVSPIEKPKEHLQTKAFSQMINKSKHQHYELLSFREATYYIYKREGIKGYYRGFMPGLVKTTLNGGTYFSTLYYFKKILMRMEMISEHAVNSLASGLARAIQSVLSNPLVVIKTRLEVLGFSEYANLHDAVRKVYVQEGLRGYFTGLKVSLIRDVPFSGIYYPIYEVSKTGYNQLLKYEEIRDEQKRIMYLTSISTLSSITANLMSCLITHPIDIIRTRIYFQKYNKDQTQHYTGIMRALFQIYQYDGLIGLFRGITPRIIRKGLGNIICWTIYEYLVDKRHKFID